MNGSNHPDTDGKWSEIVHNLKNFLSAHYTDSSGKLDCKGNDAAKKAMDALGLIPGGRVDDACVDREYTSAEIAEMKNVLMFLYYQHSNSSGAGETAGISRIGIFRRIFDSIVAEEAGEVPCLILSKISSYGIPEADLPILRKTLSYCPDIFVQMIEADRMEKASVAASGIAYRIGTKPEVVNGLFRDIIVAYGRNPEVSSCNAELEVFVDEDDAWGEALTDLDNAELGNAYDQYNLGMRYLKGDGVTPSDERYAYWIGQAAEQHYADAEYEMWFALSRGMGVPEDQETAEEFLRDAALHGSAEARKECESEGISLEIGVCIYCGKNPGKYMTADGPICSSCMPPDLIEMCAEITRDAVKEYRKLHPRTVF